MSEPTVGVEISLLRACGGISRIEKAPDPENGSSRACGGISYLEEIRSVVLALLRTRGDTPCLYGLA